MGTTFEVLTMGEVLAVSVPSREGEEITAGGVPKRVPLTTIGCPSGVAGAVTRTALVLGTIPQVPEYLVT
jgi:hypothetical protein